MRRATLESRVRRLKTVSARSGLRPVQAHSVGGVLGFRIAKVPSGKPKALGVPERRADRGLRDGDSSAVEFLTVARSCAPRDAGSGTKNDAREDSDVSNEAAAQSHKRAADAYRRRRPSTAAVGSANCELSEAALSPRGAQGARNRQSSIVEMMGVRARSAARYRPGPCRNKGLLAMSCTCVQYLVTRMISRRQVKTRLNRRTKSGGSRLSDSQAPRFEATHQIRRTNDGPRDDDRREFFAAVVAHQARPA
jgi:hypothetical protein